jgi:hypothetical protein
MEKRSLVALLLCVALSISVLAPFLAVNAAPGQYTMYVKNPDDTHDLSHVNPAEWTAGRTYATRKDGTPAGVGDLVFYTNETGAGKNFYVEVWLDDPQNDVNAYAWQVKLYYDTSLLTALDVYVPSGSRYLFEQLAGKVVDDAAGYIMIGYSRMGDVPGKNGTDVLCRIIFTIDKAPGYGESLHCDLSLDTQLSYVLNPSLDPVPVTFVPGYYELNWAPPTKYPYFEVKPSTYKATKLGEDVVFEVWVKNVDSGWEIIAFQFVLRFNATLLEATTYENGTWLDTFVNDGEMGVIYLATNDHLGEQGLPPGYNAWVCSAILMPDENGVWHAPFPSGNGLLFKLHFKAIFQTIVPEEAWTDVSISETKYFKTYVLNQYMDEIPLAASLNAMYRAPQISLGLAIDVYTQYPYPYGGQEANMPSDMFGPQQQVELYALVTYNEDPVQQKLVGFEIRHGDYVFWREATTNDMGIAHVSFRIPWPCQNPEEEIFGEWDVIATVEVAERTANDTLKFWVWWPVEILSVEPKKTEFIKNKATGCEDLEFTVIYGTYSMQIIPVTITVTVYDELGFFIGSANLNTTVGWGEYDHFGEMKTYTWEVPIPMPTNAVVGKATVYANAFTKFPWIGGVPYCPEVTNTIEFYIKKS